ncbi:universal stress protein [Geminicoccaceae bacterium 1502E]|nr:universal stress protein [Geminicoccaceae bacterium 1502E]
MGRILACTDGSLYAASVCDHAAWAAARMGVGVEVLHVLDHHRERASLSDLSGALGIDAGEELLRQLTELEETRARLGQRKGKLVLEEAARRLREAGIEDVALTQRHGALVETIAELDQRSELVVIGKRGEGADFASLHLGSNLERVARASHRPILVASRAFRPIGRLLIAFDGGPSARKAVAYVAAQKLLKGLECRLLTVGREDAQTRERLDEAATELLRGGFAVDARIVAGDPDKVIAHEVETGGIDLLVMGAYGHSRIRNLIIGSTTTAMLRSCRVPVLLLR